MGREGGEENPADNVYREWIAGARGVRPAAPMKLHAAIPHREAEREAAPDGNRARRKAGAGSAPPQQREQALLAASRLLLSQVDVDLTTVLGVVGEATDSTCVYLIPTPSDEKLVFQETSRASERTELLQAWSQARGELLPYGVSELLGDVVSWCRPGHQARPLWVQELARDTSGRLTDHAAAGSRLSVIPVISSAGRFYGYLGFEREGAQADLDLDNRMLQMFSDILAAYLGRRLAEQSQRESEERWRKLVESNPEPILIVVSDLIVYANHSAGRLLGQGDPADVIGNAPYDFVSAQDYERIESYLKANLAGQNCGPAEQTIIRFDGSERVVEWFSAPISHNGGRASQIVFRDITERKAAEWALKQSEERYRTFIETISEAIWRIELAEPVRTDQPAEAQAEQLLAGGVVAECNHAFLAMLPGERTEAEVVGRPMADLVQCLHRDLVQEFVRAGHRLRNWEYVLHPAGGKARHLLLNVVGACEGGAVARIWGSCVDVTERVEMEQQMVAALEHQQQRFGRDLHDGVGQLLTAVRMLSSNLADRFFREGDEGYSLARKVVGFSEEASVRVREIHSGMAPLHLYHEELPIVLRELVYNLNLLPNIHCVYEQTGEPATASTDIKLHLYRIAQEATNNALKYAGASKITVRLDEQPGAYQLQICDDGAGFDLSSRSKTRSLGLKSMFYRARAVGGTLEIDAHTEGPKKGTCVTVRFPRLEQQRASLHGIALIDPM